ncbi:PREDICTED: pentatricopeptide repeat-containing protein At5g19020, mitochondrial [Nelumbo nucifera]|uniref:Pentatricopeptide repeat-containing protein At5g19020, mitochondrial n=2 Tax=Nelumbo nucifera TaxID=4432 RepID=A0A1U8AN57_NELNU|nr:PREDICTED: pentatricopeptide repeat-containing protein At5g19020, mitochondrial [Nelumbo nucifera]DAD21940.1 TPA_asm: hypothetical protein HUJ06_023403 [Nelumbo nucifera]
MRRVHHVVVRRSNRRWAWTDLRKNHSLSSQPPEYHMQSLFEGRKAKKHTTCEFALVSALKSCTSLLAICQGEQIHSFALKSGLHSNLFIRNSLINFYVKCGRIEAARSMFASCSLLDSASWNIMIAGYVKLGRLEDAYQLFRIMPSRDCVSFTTMIMGFAQNDRLVEALDVFNEMRAMGVTPNEVTLASVISSYSHLGGLRDICMLHAMAIKLGLETHTLVSTNLIHMYSICSSLADARIIFDDMPERNIVSWNAMLNGYSKAGFVDSAKDLFERIPEKDLVSWGTMIDGYIRVDRLNEALVTYIEMLRAGFGPNEVMIVDILSACGRAIATNEGLQFHGAIIKTGLDCHVFMQATIIHFYSACHMIDLACLQFKLGNKENISSWNALISGFVRNNMVDLARQLFSEMPERDVVSWSSMIAGYAQSKQSNLALELFHEMITSGIQPNEITMVSILSVIATSGTLEQGRWVHDYINNNSIPLNDNLGAALIDMYAKCGSINKALKVFSQIQGRSSSISPWNAFICGLAMHGYADMSIKLFLDLQRTHIKPNSITFIGVLSACCHAGLVDSGVRYFRSMKTVYNLDPNIKHYGCMVDLLGRAGHLEEAEQLIASMPMEADVVIWGTLLAASRTHGNVEIGEKAAERLSRLEPDHGAGRILLSNIYADAGRWDDVFAVRRKMQSERMKKSPGYSGVV